MQSAGRKQARRASTTTRSRDQTETGARRAGGGGGRHERSHARIVEEAARLIRERGIAGASVDDVMAAAGLTRGGFYAHFDDKVQLAREALDFSFDRSVVNLGGPDMPTTPKEWRERATKRYLSEAHVENPGQGCAAPTLGAEVARGEPVLQETMLKQLSRVIDVIEQRIGGDPKTARSRGIAFLATCVGGVTLARAAGDRAFAREILAACRRELLDGAPDDDR